MKQDINPNLKFDQPSLKEKYRKAAMRAVKIFSQQEEVDAILIVGSTVFGELHQNSDVDIYIILDQAVDYRERGNFYVDQIEIEYFKNPPQQIRAYFESEKNNPHTAHMLATGEIVYSKSDEVFPLVQEAKKIINAGRPHPDGQQIELMKYKLDDLGKDLKDCWAVQDLIGYSATKSKIIKLVLDILFYLNRRYTPKDKWLSETLNSSYPKVYDLITKLTINHENDSDLMQRLIHEAELKLGGKREKIWVLRSELTI